MSKKKTRLSIQDGRSAKIGKNKDREVGETGIFRLKEVDQCPRDIVWKSQFPAHLSMERRTTMRKNSIKEYKSQHGSTERIKQYPS